MHTWIFYSFLRFYCSGKSNLFKIYCLYPFFTFGNCLHCLYPFFTYGNCFLHKLIIKSFIKFNWVFTQANDDNPPWHARHVEPSRRRDVAFLQPERRQSGPDPRRDWSAATSIRQQRSQSGARPSDDA